MRLTRYWSEIQAAARAHGLDPILVEAVVIQESAGNTDGFRFEPVFYNRLLKGKPEWVGQNPRRISSSYGLMQCMYVVARERGYAASLPPEGLFVPEVGLEYGCRQLAFLLNWARKGWPDLAHDLHIQAALASYNGGRGGNVPGTVLRNGVYARSVLKHFTQLLTEHVA